MSNSMALELLESLQEAGLPIDGVSVAANGSITPRFNPGASAKDQTDAAAIIAAFDKSPREPKPVEEIHGDVDKLPEETILAIVKRMIADYLAVNPSVAKEFGVVVEEKV